MSIDLTRITKTHIALVGAVGACAYATAWAEPLSVLAGGAVMGMNFVLLRLITNLLRRGVAGSESRTRIVVAVAAFVLKFGLFLGVLAALFWRLPIEGMSFALGVTLLLVACVVEVGRIEWLVAKGAS